MQIAADPWYRGDLALAATPPEFIERERAMNARNMLTGLRDVSRLLSSMRGRRKAVVWFGEGINPLPPSAQAGNAFASTASEATLTQRAMEEMLRAATRAGVTFYAVDSRGLGGGWSGGADSSMEFMNEIQQSKNFLRMVSEETGGFAVVEA